MMHAIPRRGLGPERTTSPRVSTMSPSDDQREVKKYATIPHPPESWISGNLSDIDPAFTIKSFWRLADIYGPIYSLNLINRQTIILSNYELINEVCDDERFEKHVTGNLVTIRDLLKDGLFSSFSDEEAWWVAHRTLMPAFGPLNIRRMFPKMLDIVSQMVLKWDRMGSDYVVDCNENFTMLAFDVIGLCAFNHRFNCFYSEKLPAFCDEMVQVLIETGKKANRLEIENRMHPFAERKRWENIHDMWRVADAIVAERKANPKPDVDDLLNVMLTAKDPVTGKGLSDENIRYQMVTFLVAGHETSSGTLNFLFHNLLSQPECLQKCYAEIDRVVGTGPLEVTHLPKLKYTEACIRETLRVQGPITSFIRHAKKPTTLAGKYKVDPSVSILSSLKGLHHDATIWGEDADEFRPERLLDGRLENLPPNAWKPFGTGMRACIGRSLAEQEMLTAVAMILQTFVVEMADPEYVMRLKNTLTVKPLNFKIKVRRRPGRDLAFGVPRAMTTKSAPEATGSAGSSADRRAQRPVAVFYGGNSGTCKSFAEDIQTHAPAQGLFVSGGVKSLDSATEALPTDKPVLIITASYEGMPPDNAKHFVAWLEQLSKTQKDGGVKAPLNGVKYSVMGLGNAEWSATFHRIPKLVDALMQELGATPVTKMGLADVSQDIVGPFDEWKDSLFPCLREATGAQGEVKKTDLQIEVEHPEIRKKLAGDEVVEGMVLSNKVLAEKGLGPKKMHMEVLLPAGSDYQSGDYIVVLPYNNRESIGRVLRRFGLHADDLITISNTDKGFLKGFHKSDTHAPAASTSQIAIFTLLGSRVELATPASQRQIAILAAHTPATGASATSHAHLDTLSRDKEAYQTLVLTPRASVIDILEDHPLCALPFAAYLDMLAPLSARQYSISSSPLSSQPHPEAEQIHAPHQSRSSPLSSDSEESSHRPIATITYDVFEGPAFCNSKRAFHGVTTTYLSSLLPGSRIRCFVRATNAPFHLPRDPKTPVIMIAAGTGVAPMRAFVQERAVMKDARRGSSAEREDEGIEMGSGDETSKSEEVLGPAVLYYGCRGFDEDFLFREEFLKWAKEGVVEVRPAFSCPSVRAKYGFDEASGTRSMEVDQRQVKGQHVDELVWEDRERLRGLFARGAKILVCGSARLGRSIQEVCSRVYREAFPGASREDAEKWLAKQKEERFVSDVFG